MSRPQSRSIYNMIWRWHFYAGLFCVPFILILAVTGSVYLFKPQIEAWVDAPYNNLELAGQPATATVLVRAALAAVPDATFKSYRLPVEPDDAVQIAVNTPKGVVQVYLHPETARVLHTVMEQERFIELVKNIHGELLLGSRGSLIVELAACWAIVMIITGLYLWWPVGSARALGALIPRFSAHGRMFWRDIHATTGVWISVFALFLLLSGLPWTGVWGGFFSDIRKWSNPGIQEQAWSTGREEIPEGHDHGQHTDMPQLPENTLAHTPTISTSLDKGLLGNVALDAMVEAVRPLHLAPPVLVSAPSNAFPRSKYWTARSDTQNRPERVTLILDSATGAILQRKNFEDKPVLDRILGYGIAAHEGQLFGLANQLLGLFTATGLIALSVSGYVMWWKRRPKNKLGAPPMANAGRPPIGLCLVITGLGLFLPVLGLSMIFLFVLEYAILRRVPYIRQWLGLSG